MIAFIGWIIFLGLRFISISQIIASISGVLINIYFARSLDIARFGEYAFLTGIAFFLATLNGAGVQQALLSQRYDREQFFFNSARLLNILTIVVLSLLALFIASLLAYDKILTAILLFAAFSLRDFGKKELVARGQYKEILAIEVSTFLLLCVVTFISFELKENKNPELVVILSYSISCITLSSVIVPKLRFISEREIFQILDFVKWILPAALFSMAGIPVLPIAIGLVLGAESVGIYRGIQNVFGMSNVVNQIYDTWLQPKSREIGAQQLVGLVQLVNLSLFVIVGLAVYAYGGVVFETIYGQSFVTSKQFSVNLVLAAYALFGASVFLTVERIRTKVFGQPTNLLKSAAFYCLVCALSYFAFIFFRSLSGVVWLLTICSTLTSLYLLLLVKNDRSGFF